MHIRVECYAGYKGEQEPRRLYLGRRPVDVNEILDRWLAPEHAYFKVSDPAGNIYILRHDTTMGFWELTLFDSLHRPGAAGRSGNDAISP
ncbi:hypothetical protein [Marinobacterium aestuariivivens]|uniref:FHA domain-containing protein n=1 Tax=Marinobacterium aestuariivivens TaxID=1698799 RepID=A0ABW2A728_9GAMM